MDDLRRTRLEEQLREEIARLISMGEVKDPRVGPFVSVTRVEASRDGSHAKVYVSSFAGASFASNPSDADNEAQLVAAAAALNHAAGFVQAQLARRIRMRLTPVLHFIADRGIREGFEMTEKIKGLLS